MKRKSSFRALLMRAALEMTSLGQAAAPGLPFTEDCSDTALRDEALTHANWSTEESALLFAWPRAHFGVFGPGLVESDISTDAHHTYSVALADVDGHGDLYVVAGNASQPNRLNVNNSNPSPFTGIVGVDIITAAHDTRSVALGDGGWGKKIVKAGISTR